MNLTQPSLGLFRLEWCSVAILDPTTPLARRRLLLGISIGKCSDLGIAKTFRLFKPVIAQASWLEIQHWGTNFHCLLGDNVALPDQPAKESEAVSEDSTADQEPK